MPRGYAYSETSLVQQVLSDRGADGVEQSEGGNSSSVAIRRGGGRQCQRERALHQGRVAQSQQQPSVVEEKTGGRTLDDRPGCRLDEVKELISGPLLPLTHLDPQQSVIPVQKTIHEARVRSADRDIQHGEGIGAKIAAQLKG